MYHLITHTYTSIHGAYITRYLAAHTLRSTRFTVNDTSRRNAIIADMMMLVAMLVGMLAVGHTRPTCYLGHRDQHDPLYLCGCHGISPRHHFLWNLLLPPHAGTGTATSVFKDILGVKTCSHEHTPILSHELDLKEAKKHCVTHQNNNPLCKTLRLIIPEFNIVLARNPYQRLLTAAFYLNVVNSTQDREIAVQSFRKYVRSYANRSHARPITEMMTNAKGVLIRPDFIVSDENPQLYRNNMENLIRVLGYRNASTMGRVDEFLQLGGHHLRRHNTLTIQEFYDATTANMVYKHYVGDFKYFKFEANVALLPN